MHVGSTPSGPGPSGNPAFCAGLIGWAVDHRICQYRDTGCIQLVRLGPQPPDFFVSDLAEVVKNISGTAQSASRRVLSRLR